MNPEVFRNISRIIERDSKSTTYKFALLRGVIDIIGEASPYIGVSKEKAHIPLGLLIEKWITYYYPILDSEPVIPQINGTAKLAFQEAFVPIIQYYSIRGGLSAFYSDLRSKGVPATIAPAFLQLVTQLKSTITRMPMRYIGNSVYNYDYSVFSYHPAAKGTRTIAANLEGLIHHFGTFSIPIDYYEAFRIMGSFLAGTDSILFKWAEFSVTASGKSLTTETVISEVLKSPITERDAAEAKKLYASMLRDTGTIKCVWTDKAITTYDVDHLIPFTIWKNNDLWNLMPAQATVNNKKKHFIPEPALLDKRKDAIIHYWEITKAKLPERFSSEIQLALLGNSNAANWQNTAFAQLKETARYLIETRGFKEWNNP